MKKVLALVLALTMVLGFAATASASYFGNYKTEFFKTAYTSLTVGGSNYVKDMSVDGNKEYTVKYTFDSNQINPPLGSAGSAYDALYKEYRVLDVIESYTFNNFVTTGSWLINGTGGVADGGSEILTAAAAAINGTDADVRATAIWQALVNGATATTTFKDAYNSSAFQNKKADIERSWNNYYSVNSYFGYDKGVTVTATSKDTTYATITSAPTVSAKRVGNSTEFTAEFKVKFTNTTFRTADVDLEVVFLAGGVNPNDYYETKETLSFTVYQAQYRTFTAQDATIAFGVTPNVEISADTLEIGFISPSQRG